MSARPTGPSRDDPPPFDDLAPPVPSGIERISDLRVGSGVLAVGDLGGWGDPAAHPRFEVPAGRLRLDLCRIDEGPALLRVLLHPARAIRWEPALGTDGRGRPHGVALGSGTLTLLDAAYVPALAGRWAPAHPHAAADGRALGEAMAAQGGDWGEWWFVPGRPERLVVVRPGQGAGACPVFWGLDAEGRRVALVFDFLLAREAPPAELPAELPAVGLRLVRGSGGR